MVGVPLLRDGEVVATLSVHSHEPRAWTDEELELIQETADRTWPAVERARAEAGLRRQLTVANTPGVGVLTWDAGTATLSHDIRIYDDVRLLEAAAATSGVKCGAAAGRGIRRPLPVVVFGQLS